MNRSLIVLLLTLPFFTACKREYARVQPAKPDFFVQKQRTAVKKEIAPIAVDEPKIIESETPGVIEALPTKSVNVETDDFPDLVAQKPLFGGGKKKHQIEKRGVANFLEKVFPNQQLKETPKKQVKKKKKRRTRWNPMIPAGFIFLGIAILLALINLNGLALLFGVASILFLFFGFKKLFRKKRRRSIFK